MSGDVRLLNARAADARSLAIRRLLESRGHHGAWEGSIDLNALYGAVFIIMLRATGLIEAEHLQQDEVRIVRHMLTQINADGGFWKYRGAPSSRSITRLAVLALRACAGELNTRRWPAWRPTRNILVDGELADRVHGAIAGAERFLAARLVRSGRWTFDLDLLCLECLLRAYVEGSPRARVLRFVLPRLPGVIIDPPRDSWARQLNAMVRKALPACSILASRIRRYRGGGQATVRLSPQLAGGGAPREAAVERAAAVILREQNENGGWAYNALFTMLNVMALREAGVPLKDASIVTAVAYLRANLVPAGDERAFLTFLGNDTWCTAAAVWVCLGARDRHTPRDGLRPTVEWLLRAQHPDGSFAFASASLNDTDHDTTGTALLTLATARQAGMRLAELDLAIDRAIAFLRSRQDRHGGFSAFDPSLVKARPGAQHVLKAVLLDVATADITARVLTGLGRAGLTVADDCVRRALHFLRRIQHRNGAWWGRSWAGYVAATGAVLYAFGEVGFRMGGTRPELAAIRDSMTRGVEFLRRHQHPDGGWGETNEADRDERLAGAGPSTPLHTAYALVGLLRCGVPPGKPPITRAITYLVETMTADGRWPNDDAMYTVFPGALYFSHPLFGAIMVPMALNHFLDACATDGPFGPSLPDEVEGVG